MLKIIAQCLDTFGRVRTIQTPDSNILACNKLLHSVRTHWAKSEPSRHPILTFLHARNYCTVSGIHWPKSKPSRHLILTFLPAKNYCTVSTDNWAESESSRHLILTIFPAKNYCTVFGHIGPNPNHPDTQFWYSCLLDIIGQCPDSLARIWTIQTPNSDILSC